jgi:AraC-like DNA-binding protein
MEPEYTFYFKNEIRPLASLSLIECACLDCPAGFILPIKKPDTFGLCFVRHGKGVYTVSTSAATSPSTKKGDTEYPASGGDIFAVYPNTIIKCRADDVEPWSLYWVSFDGIDARLLLNAANFQPKAPLRHMEAISAEGVVKIMEGFNALHVPSLFGSILSTATLHLLLSLLVKTASWNPADMPSGWTATVHFQKALNYIGNNYQHAISVDGIAGHVCITRSRLFQIFKQQIFMSPQQYLTEYRIREARNLLDKRSGSVKEIALAVGIEDSQYFSRVFRQFTGKSPTEWQRAKCG